jgi:hypothetical protein
LKKVEDPVPEPEPVEEMKEEPIAGAPSVSEEDQFVRPSDVASEQMEVEAAEPEPPEVIEEPPPPEEEVVEAPASTEMDMERGREVVQDILEKVKAAEARSRGEEVEAPPEIEVEAPPEEIAKEVEEPITYEEPVADADVEEVFEEEVVEEEKEETIAEELEFQWLSRNLLKMKRSSGLNLISRLTTSNLNNFKRS